MKLEVMSMSFLRSGALSVEVGAQTQKDAGTDPFVDVVKMWVYLPSFDKNDTMQNVIDNALRIASQMLK